MSQPPEWIPSVPGSDVPPKTADSWWMRPECADRSTFQQLAADLFPKEGKVGMQLQSETSDRTCTKCGALIRGWNARSCAKCRNHKRGRAA